MPAFVGAYPLEDALILQFGKMILYLAAGYSN